MAAVAPTPLVIDDELEALRLVNVAPAGRDKGRSQLRFVATISSIGSQFMSQDARLAEMLSIRDPPTPQSIGSSVQEDVVAKDTSVIDRLRDQGNSYCYRHRPEAQSLRADDEARLVALYQDLAVLDPADQEYISHIWTLFGAAPARQRYLILRGILTQCCFPQLSAVSREANQHLRLDFISVLPVEISERILGYLDTASLCRASQVSRWWRELADADGVWRRMCVQHIDRKCTKCGWGLPLLERKRLGLKGPMERVTMGAEGTWPSLSLSRKRTMSSKDGPSAKRHCASPLIPTGATAPAMPRSRPWKDVYRDRWRVGVNWKLGRYREQTLTGHSGWITYACFEGDILATASRDSTVKIWNAKTGDELRTLSGHAGPVTTLQCDNGKLISGSEDTTIKIWSWRTGECLNTLQVHSRPVTTLHFDGKYLVSGSENGVVKLFDFETKRTFSLVAHAGAVSHIRIDLESKTIFTSCASDSTGVKMWDLETLQECKHLYDHHGHVQQLLLMPDDFEPDEATQTVPWEDSGSNRGTPSPQDERALYGDLFTSDVTRPLPPRHLLTTSTDNIMRLWDTASGNCLRTTCVNNAAGVLVGDTLRVITTNEKSGVKVWEPTSGKGERVFTGPESSISTIGLSDARMAIGTVGGGVVLYSFDYVEERLNGECVAATG